MRQATATPLKSSDRGEDLLQLNSRHYDRLLAFASSLGPCAPETRLRVLEVLSEYASLFHSGRYADGALDDRGLEVARELNGTNTLKERLGPSRELFRRTRTAKRQILHVAEGVWNNGGLTRTIYHWIKMDRASNHSMVLHRQSAREIPVWLQQAIEESGGTLTVFPDAGPFVAKAARLREVARTGYDALVMHVTSYDATIMAAFGADGGPPIGTINHWDHAFWMGSSVTDLVIHQRHISQPVCDQRRHTRRGVVLPIPLGDPTPQMVRNEVRARLGIPTDRMVVLSVGRACKYLPSSTHDFFSTVNKLLNEHPEAHVYIVGVGEGDYPHVAPKSDRLHLLGFVEDPTPYHKAADVYLEGFPFGSQTALLEAGLAELPVVRAYAPPFDMAVANDESFWGVAESPESEDEYLAQAGRFIRELELRREVGRTLRERILQAHVGEGWRGRLAAVYEQLAPLTHTTSPIPHLPCESQDIDRALCVWQDALAGGGASDAGRIEWIRQSIVNAAYMVRRAGYYRDSHRLLQQCASTWGHNRGTRLALAKLPVCWALGR
jgi:glycosyltransferase involved in cell wall biosynthesis